MQPDIDIKIIRSPYTNEMQLFANVSQFILLYIIGELNKQFVGEIYRHNCIQEMEIFSKYHMTHLIQAGCINFDFITMKYEVIGRIPGIDLKEYYKYYLRK